MNLSGNHVGKRGDCNGIHPNRLKLLNALAAVPPAACAAVVIAVKPAPNWNTARAPAACAAVVIAVKPGPNEKALGPNVTVVLLNGEVAALVVLVVADVLDARATVTDVPPPKLTTWLKAGPPAEKNTPRVREKTRLGALDCRCDR